MAAKTAESPGSLLASARSRAQEAAEDIRSLLDQLRTLSPRLTELFKNSKCAFPEPETSCNDEQREVGFLAWYSACAAACRDTVRERLLTLCGDPSSQQFSPEQNGGIEDVALLAKADYVYWWKKQPEVPIKPKLLNEVEEESESTEEEQRDEQTAQDLMQNLKMLEVDLDEERAASLETEASFTIKKSRNIEIKPNDQSSADRIHNAITSARPELKIAMNSNSKVLTIQFKKQSVKGNEQSHLNQQRIDAFLAKAEEICKLAGQEIAKGKSHRERKAEYAREQLESIQLELPKYHLPPAKQQVLTNKVLNRLAMIDYIQKEKAFDQWVEKANSAFADFEKIQPVDIRHAERIDSDVNSIVETVSLLRERVQSAISAMDSDTFFGTLQKADKSIASVVEEAEQLYAEAVREEAKAREGVGGGRKKSRKRGKRKGERRGGSAYARPSGSSKSKKSKYTQTGEPTASIVPHGGIIRSATKGLSRQVLNRQADDGVIFSFKSALKTPGSAQNLPDTVPSLFNLSQSLETVRFAQRQSDSDFPVRTILKKPSEVLANESRFGFLKSKDEAGISYRIPIFPVKEPAPESAYYNLVHFAVNLRSWTESIHHFYESLMRKVGQDTPRVSSAKELQIQEAFLNKTLPDLQLLEKNYWYEHEAPDEAWCCTLRDIMMELGHYLDSSGSSSDIIHFACITSLLCKKGLQLGSEQYIASLLESPPEEYSSQAVESILALERLNVEHETIAAILDDNPLEAYQKVKLMLSNTAASLADTERSTLHRGISAQGILVLNEILGKMDEIILTTQGWPANMRKPSEKKVDWNYGELHKTNCDFSEEEQKIVAPFCTRKTEDLPDTSEFDPEKYPNSLQEIEDLAEECIRKDSLELQKIFIEFLKKHYPQLSEKKYETISDEMIQGYISLFGTKHLMQMLANAKFEGEHLDMFTESAIEQAKITLCDREHTDNIRMKFAGGVKADAISSFMMLLQSERAKSIYFELQYQLDRFSAMDESTEQQHRTSAHQLCTAIANDSVKDDDSGFSDSQIPQSLITVCNHLEEHCSSLSLNKRWHLAKAFINMFRLHEPKLVRSAEKENHKFIRKAVKKTPIVKPPSDPPVSQQLLPESGKDSFYIVDSKATLSLGSSGEPVTSVCVSLAAETVAEIHIDQKDILTQEGKFSESLSRYCKNLSTEQVLNFFSDTEENAKDIFKKLRIHCATRPQYVCSLQKMLSGFEKDIPKIQNEEIKAKAVVCLQLIVYEIARTCGVEVSGDNSSVNDRLKISGPFQRININIDDDLDGFGEQAMMLESEELKIKVLYLGVALRTFMDRIKDIHDRMEADCDSETMHKFLEPYRAEGKGFADHFLRCVQESEDPIAIHVLSDLLDYILYASADYDSHSARAVSFYAYFFVAQEMNTLLEKHIDIPEHKSIPKEVSAILQEVDEISNF